MPPCNNGRNELGGWSPVSEYRSGVSIRRVESAGDWSVNRVRQGIADGGRHIAPALLLC